MNHSADLDNSARHPSDSLAVMRILDASANRATEGLRVVEDFLRFAQNQSNASRECKQLRHDLGTLLTQLPLSTRLAARNVPTDVGRLIQTSQEYERESIENVVWANLKRAQQAIRSLEEFGKTLSPTWAQAMEQIRYRSYTLEQTLSACTVTGGRTPVTAKLCVLIDHGHSRDDFQRRVSTLIEAGVPLLQLRDKKSLDTERIAVAEWLVRLTEKTATRVIINDRPDIAASVGAAGVHVGQDDFPIGAARRVLHARQWVGVSTHGVDQALAAQKSGADYIGAGPTFPSTTKSFEAFAGVDYLRQVAEQIAVPAFAIGGIQLDNLDRVLETGIGRVAVASAVWNAPNPGTAAMEFIQRLP